MRRVVDIEAGKYLVRSATCAKHTPHAIGRLEVDFPKRHSGSANGVRLGRLVNEGDRRFHRWQGALVPFPAEDVAAIFVQHDFLEHRGLFDTYAEYLRVAIRLNAQIEFYNIMMAGVAQGSNRAASDQITLAKEHIAPKCKELLEILDRFQQRLAKTRTAT